MYNVLDSATSGVEKKTRKNESNSDLQALINGLRRTGTARTQFIYDNVNVPAMVNYLDAMIITGGVDCCHKNYYAYRDTEGTGEWQFLPWDLDLTFGRNWTGTLTYFDDTMYISNPLFIGDNNALVGALFGTPAIRRCTAPGADPHGRAAPAARNAVDGIEVRKSHKRTRGGHRSRCSTRFCQMADLGPKANYAAGSQYIDE
jgi:spore coat protein CotH